jgi:hypothetical protein
MIEFIKKHYGKIGMSFALVMLVINYFQQRELTQLRAGQKIEVIVGGDIAKANLIDSLNDELFNAKVENGRYELSLQHLYEVNPKAGKEFQDYMEHETE